MRRKMISAAMSAIAMAIYLAIIVGTMLAIAGQPTAERRPLTLHPYQQQQQGDPQCPWNTNTASRK